MKRLLLISICLVSLLAPTAVLAADRSGFNGVVSFIESRYHVQPEHTPVPWWVKAISHNAVRNAEAGLPMANFTRFSGPVGTEELYRVVQEKLGPGWERVIRETGRKPDSTAAIPHGWDRKGDEQTLMFIRPEGEQMAVFFLDYDGDQLFVLQITADPGHIDDTVGQYQNRGNKSESD